MKVRAQQKVVKLLYFYDAKSAYIITNVDGQTRVKVCEPGKLTPEEQELINSTMRKTHVLDSYAYMVRQRDKQRAREIP